MLYAERIGWMATCIGISNSPRTTFIRKNSCDVGTQLITELTDNNAIIALLFANEVSKERAGSRSLLTLCSRLLDGSSLRLMLDFI